MAPSTTDYQYYTGTTWNSWNDGTSATITTSGSASTTWINWYDASGTPYGCNRQAGQIPETVEERKQRTAREKTEEAERKRQAQEKEDRATALLASLIGMKQTKVYQKTGRVLVKGEQFDYLIPKSGYVTRVGKDRLEDLCIGIADKFRYHEIDNVIGLKLAIEADEMGFNQKANVQGSRDRVGELPMAAQA